MNCISLKVLHADVTDTFNVALIDSSRVVLKKPSASQENSVFSDPKLEYNLNLKYEPGIFERFMNWLAEKLFGDNNYRNIALTQDIIMWSVVVVSVIIVILLLLRSDLSRLIRPESKRTTFNFSEITDDLSTINFDKMIDEALKNSDHRTAVRWNYLKCLYVLERGGHLIFQPAKTNIDYQYDLKRSPFFEEFMTVSRIYEYVWYGKFEVNDTKYNELRSEFRSFESKLDVQGK